MISNKLFIEKYKELEKILDISIREYEEALPEEQSNKLKYCRITRNYIQHEIDSDKFIIISDAMYNFICGLLQKEIIKNGQVKDIMTSCLKFGSIDIKDCILEAAQLMDKKHNDKLLVFEGSDYVGMLYKNSLFSIMSSGITKSAKIVKYKEYIQKPQNAYYILNTESSNKIQNLKTKYDEIFVVNKNNKIIGIIE